MKLAEYLIFPFVFLNFVSAEGLEDYKEMVTSILDYFRCRSVIFVINDVNSDIKFLKLQKFLNSNNDLYFSTTMTLSTLSKTIKREYHVGKRTMVVVEFSEKLFNETFPKFTHEVDITPYKWLITTPTLNSVNVKNLRIPFLCEFMIATGNESLGYNLTEIYKIEEDTVTRYMGSWVVGSPLDISPVEFFTRRKNMEKAVIKVAIHTTDLCPQDLSFINGTAQIVVCFQKLVWDAMTEMLNFTSKTILIPHLRRDTVALMEGIHLTLRSAPFNTRDLNTRTYPWPLIRAEFEVFASYVGQEFDWATFVLPFSNQMWMAIGIWVVACDLILVLAEFIANAGDKKEKPLLNYYSKYSFLNLFAFSNQGVSDTPGLFSYRVLLFLMFTVPAVLLPAYSAVLTSFVTVLLPKMPFKNLQELSQTPDYTLGWHRPLPYQVMFRQNDTNPLNQALMANNVLKEHEMPPTDSEGVNRLCSEKFAYITTISTMIALKPKCKFFKLDKHFLNVFAGMEVKKNLQYEFLFSRCIRRLRMSGVLNRQLREVLVKILPFETLPPPEMEDVHPIIMENCILPFIILFITMILSVFTFVLEVVYSKLKAPRLVYLP